MRVMVIVKATPSSEAGQLPDHEMLAAMGRYNEMLAQAGVMLAGEGLHPSRRGARVRFSGRERIVTDGPFAETKELIAGFWLWRVASLAEAVEWVRKCPNPMPEESEIEIRQVFEAADFGDEFSPELREQEAGVRARALGLQMLDFRDGPRLFVAGVRGDYALETRGGIAGQWCAFVSRLDEIAGRIGDATYGVSWNATRDGSFSYLAAVEVAQLAGVPASFTALEIKPRRYAVFRHAEHVSTISQTIDSIWRQWAPDCGLAVDRAAPCFERYTGEFDAGSGLGGMEIWIPLEEAG